MDRSLMKASKNLHDRWHATDGRARLLYGDVTGGRVRGFFVRRSGSLKKKKNMQNVPGPSKRCLTNSPLEVIGSVQKLPDLVSVLV